MTFDFKKSLAAGQSGEELFDLADSDFTRTDGYKGDFINKKTGAKLELKTDSYDINRTPNVFMERWSDKAKEKPGGPWQAKEHGCSIYAYYFLKNGIVFYYDIDRLINILESKKRCQVWIRNRAWITSGYKVKREELTAALIKIREI